MFLQRIKAARSLGINERASHQVISRHSMNLMYQIEIQAMKEYFANIIAPVRARYLSERLDMTTLVDHFSCVWVVFEVVLATMRNHGDLSRKIFYMDESFVPATSDASERFFSSSMATTHAETVGRYVECTALPRQLHRSRQCAQNCMKWQLLMAGSLKRTGLDEMALATLFRLIFSRYEKDFFPSLNVHSEYVNGILREFHHHCKDRRVDYFAELDKIASLLHCFHQTFTAWMDTFTMIDLCTPTEDDTNSIWSLSLYRRRKNVDRLLCLPTNAILGNANNAIQYL
ncbi:hypothetical protein AAVH_18849 [Aphelenchoides avenae]|nr:hypothetical protein AAVH_18849 [Aphelenchus avenae]